MLRRDAVSQAPPPPQTLEGFLTKRGAVRKNWKRRWFTLAGQSGYCAYFRTRLDEEPLGAFSCRGCWLVTDGTTELEGAQAVVDAPSLFSGALLPSSSTTTLASLSGSVDGQDSHSIGGGVTARARSALKSRGNFSGSASRQNPNAFSVIVRTDGHGHDSDDGSVSASHGHHTRRYIMAAPTRQLRLEWMATIAAFASQVIGESDAVDELASAIRERARQRQDSFLNRPVTETYSTADRGRCHNESASEEFIDLVVAELDTFALDIPQHRQAVLVTTLQHAKVKLTSVFMRRLLLHLVFDDDREMCLTLALDNGCLDRVDAERLIEEDLKAENPILGPLELDVLDKWLQNVSPAENE